MTGSRDWFRLLATRHARWLDTAIFVALSVGYCTWLLNTVYTLGYARDEGFYFQAADSYRRWFELLWEDPGKAIEQRSVDRYWRVNSEHPALIKSLFALSRALLHDEWRLFEEPGTSYRFVGMLLSSLAVGVTYLWGVTAFRGYGPWLSRAGALVAGASFALIPRVFYHSHLDCFDMPVLAMWLFTSYIYELSLRRRSLKWVFLAGIFYGLLLNTKHNAWLLPFALILHVLLTRAPELWEGLRAYRLRVPPALWAMALMGPLVFFAMWPWIWFDTYQRLYEYVIFHTQHVYYNMEFLGRTYFEPPFPRSYAWLMTAATVPSITLGLFAAGLLAAALRVWHTQLAPWIAAARARGVNTALLQSADRWPPTRLLSSSQVLWLACILASYAPWWSTSSPIFGGTKHWITAYPFMALFGGYAFILFARAAQRAVRDAWRWNSAWLLRLPVALLLVSVLVGPLIMTGRSHPWGLSWYTPLVGSAPGAATLGLNRSFWGYTTGAVQDFINHAAEPRDKVFIHDTAMQSWQMMRRDGRLRKDLRPQLHVSGSELAIYHHEQHMAKVEYQIWVDYGTVTPAHIGAFQGVPVVWVYQRPRPQSK